MWLACGKPGEAEDTTQDRKLGAGVRGRRAHARAADTRLVADVPSSPLFSDPSILLQEVKLLFLFVFKRDKNSRRQHKLVGGIWWPSKSLLPLTPKVVAGCLVSAWPLSLRVVLWEACSFLNSLAPLPRLPRDLPGRASSRMPSWD